MAIYKRNILTDRAIHEDLPESFESLVETPGLLVERIVTGENFQTPGHWYDQEKDEWVLLLQGNAELEFENEEIITMIKGDYILIPSHQRHRIKSASKSPVCIWLGIHSNFK